MDARILSAIALLKKCKAKGLILPAARKVMQERGFTEAEVNIALARYSYNANDNLSAEEVLARATVASHHTRERVKAHAREQVAKGALGIMLGGYFGEFFRGKAVSGAADLQDLEEGRPLSSRSKPGERVYERNRTVRYYAWMFTIPLIFVTPLVVSSVLGLMVTQVGYPSPPVPNKYAGFNILSISLIYVALLATVIALFMATHEKTIRTAYTSTYVAVAFLFVIMSATLEMPVALVGLVLLVPAFWIDNKVGLLSRL